MKKIILILLLVSSLFAINTSSALMIAEPEVKIEYKLQNKIDTIFSNIENKISNKDLKYKQDIYDKILVKIDSMYEKYPNLSGKSLAIIKYIENKAISEKENLLVDNIFDGIYEEENIEANKYEISDGEYILGNKDAKISFIEYSDIECPFCARLHNAGTVEDILKKYEGKVNFIFKHFPLSFHKKALILANAAECAGEQGGSEKYYNFILKAFENNSDIYSEYYISDLVKEIGLDKDEFDVCLKSEKYNDKIDKQMKQGAELGVTGTPGNVIMNNETGDFKLVSGAYPTSHFIEVIDEMLK